MLVDREAFSFRDITEGEAELFRIMWGGKRPGREVVSEFLERGGRPLLRDPELKRYLLLAQAAVQAG